MVLHTAKRLMEIWGLWLCALCCCCCCFDSFCCVCVVWVFVLMMRMGGGGLCWRVGSSWAIVVYPSTIVTHPNGQAQGCLTRVALAYSATYAHAIHVCIRALRQHHPPAPPSKRPPPPPTTHRLPPFSSNVRRPGQSKAGREVRRSAQLAPGVAQQVKLRLQPQLRHVENIVELAPLSGRPWQIAGSV